MKKNGFLLLILAVGFFGIINTEMGLIGILPLIATEFQVSLPIASSLISCFALGVAVAGPTMPLLFSKLDRKTAMLLALGIFSISNLISSFTSNFSILLIARIIPAFFQPVYVAMALTMAEHLVDKDDAPKAIARVFIGVSAGMVLGVPITNFVAHNYSFSYAMLGFFLVNITIFILTIFFVPKMPVTQPLSYGEQLSVLKSPALLLSLLIVIALNAAVFGFYSYLSDFLAKIGGFTNNAISLLLLLYGLANIVGNLLAGNTLSTHPQKTITATLGSLIISYGILFLTGTLHLSTILLVFLIGVLAGLIANINQYLINVAAPKAPEFANGLFLTACNLGTTFGTAFCGLLLSHLTVRYTLLGAILCLFLAGICLLGKQRLKA